MATDFATLGLRIDAADATREAEGLGAKLDQLGQQGEKARDSMGRFVKGAGSAGDAARGLGEQATRAGRQLDILGATGSHVGDLLKSALAWMSVGLVTRAFIKNTEEAQDAMAQLEARVRSTGGAAGMTVSQLDALSSAVAAKTRFSDEAVKEAESLLLTFTKIGAGVMPQATMAVADIATALRTDLKSAAIQVGKALQDPEQGLLALRRSGVSFSDAQQDVIKHLFATGHVAEAQRLIIAELRKEFGGAATAARSTLGGALEGLGNAFGDVFEISKENSGGLIVLFNDLAENLPLLRENLAQFIGGLQLLWVDLVAGIQFANAKIYNGTASMLDMLASIFVSIPGLAQQVDPLVVASVKLKAEAKLLTDAYTAWHAEQVKLITGTQAADVATKSQSATLSAFAQAVATAKTALDQKRKAAELDLAVLEKTSEETYLLMIAEERLAKARGKLQDAAKLLVGTATLDIKGMPDLDKLIPDLAKETEERRIAWEKFLEWKAAQAKKFDDAIAAANAARAEAEAQEKKRIEENFLREWQQSFSTGIEGMLTNGLSSWRGFFDSLKSLWVKLVADMFSKKVMEGPLKGVLEGLLGTGSGTGPAATPGATSSTSAGSGSLAGLGAGITGAMVGYASKNPWSGAISGALSGFVQTGNPWGAVIGGVAGLVGGLFGQAEAARKAAEQMRQAREKLDADLQQFASRASGSATQFTDSIAQVNAMAGALEAQAKAAGSSWDVLKRIDDLRLKEIARLTELEAIKQREMQQDYQVRTLRAQGLSEEAAALALAQAQEREYNKAKQEGATAATLAALATAQAAEKQRFLIDQQIAGIEKQIAAYDQQVSAARAVVDATRAIRDTLRDYVTGLTRQGMSPTEQLFASRGDFTSALAAAQGGDRTAAQKLPQLADAFLSLSKVFNASGAGFQEDRTLVQTSLSSLADDFTAQLTVQEQQLAALETIRAAAQAQLDAIKAADAAAREAAKAALAASQATATNTGSTATNTGSNGPRRTPLTIEESSVAAIVEPMLTELRAVVNSLVGGFTVQGEKLDALSAGITDVATQVRRMREVVNT